MIFAMVVIGGVTRLTESGLSIAEWRPLAGIVPPRGEAEWQRLFALYRQIPEYAAFNRGMSLAEFKGIFWWEYVHRLWGRLIGVVFALPFLYFLWRRRIPRRLVPHLVAMLGLGAAQGFVGWYMVESGLSQRTDVSQYRLTGHLALALAIYGYMLWTALTLLRPAAPPLPGRAAQRLRRRLLAATGVAGLAILAGGLVAGLDAGFIYNSFPLMGGRLVPADALSLEPAWINLFENPAAAQFVHRVLAVGLAALTAWLWLGGRAASLPARARGAVSLFAAMVFAQAGLGIATLLLAVPIPLAAAHQAGAVVLLTLALWAQHELRGAGRETAAGRA